MQKSKIIIAVTGGISAYKSLDVISGLKKLGHDVIVIATEDSKHFVTTESLNVISGGNYKEDVWNSTLHIDLAKWCDVFVVVPATMNTIAKLANGLADHLLTQTYFALPPDKKRIVFPAMNTEMFNSVVNLLNIQSLEDFGVTVIKPASGLLACGDVGVGKLPNPRDIIEEIQKISDALSSSWLFPLSIFYKGVTNDAYSFLDQDWKTVAEVPILPHVGAFGVRRRHDVHKGIDIYADENANVYAVEDGEIVEICPFTGPKAGYEWWLDTQAVYVSGKTGIVVYGEIEPISNWKQGDKVMRGDIIGNVRRVIKNDKGRPTTMLHLELHAHGHIHTGQWELNKQAPEGILDPTKYLIHSEKHF